MAVKKIIEATLSTALVLLIIWFSATFGINITAAQINWSSVTFSIGFILGALLTIFYLKRATFVRMVKKMTRAIKSKF